MALRSTSHSSATFSFSDVQKCTKGLKTAKGLRLDEKIGCKPESYALSLSNVVETSIAMNSFVNAVHLAFSHHYPLVLSPDMIWLCIMQGLSFHINANAEQLRKHFVSHEGKKELHVRRYDFVKGLQNPWEEVFPEFTDQIKEHIGSETHDLIMPRFSTTGPVEKAVCEIVLMESMKSYFKYQFHSLCGIPEITLEGTTADWQLIRKNAENLTQYDLGWWIPHLLPVLDQFVAASSGKINKKFWSSLYKINGASGGDYVSGWILKLFPYIGVNGDTRSRWLESSEGKKNPWAGVTTEQFPSGLSQAPFQWHYFAETYNMSFVGGFLATAQDPDTLAIRPQIGWAIVDKDQILKGPACPHRFPF
jgi:hypothetical protein